MCIINVQFLWCLVLFENFYAVARVFQVVAMCLKWSLEIVAARVFSVAFKQLLSGLNHMLYQAPQIMIYNDSVLNKILQ